jgi:hypothetical protein
MVNTPIQADSQKITVTLPTALLTRLREHVPARQRSRFILEALEEQIVALAETAGAWSEQNHPEMRTDEDLDRWLGELRRSWSRKES